MWYPGITKTRLADRFGCRFKAANRRGRTLRLPLYRHANSQARAGVEACPYRTLLVIEIPMTSINTFPRMGGPLCLPARIDI